MMEQEPMNNSSLQDIEQSKHISSTPVRYRSMKEAIDENQGYNVSTHKINEDIVPPPQKHVRIEENDSVKNIEPVIRESTHMVPVHEFLDESNNCLSQKMVEAQSKLVAD